MQACLRKPRQLPGHGTATTLNEVGCGVPFVFWLFQMGLVVATWGGWYVLRLLRPFFGAVTILLWEKSALRCGHVGKYWGE